MCNGQTWHKKNGTFDVAQGSYDGAEICEIIGIMVLHKLSQKFPEDNLGLYRDDGLGVTSKHGHLASTMEKELHGFFKVYKLKISTQINMKSTDFLDILLDLSTGKTSPYRKPNHTPSYVHRNSSHPPHILKQIPLMVQGRLSCLSSSENEFKNVSPSPRVGISQNIYTSGFFRT